MSATSDQREELYRKHAAGAYRRALRLMSNAADAAEVVHDVFVSLYERPSLHQVGNLNAYLYGAVTHACLKRLRDHRTRSRIVSEQQPVASPHGMHAESSLIARSTLASMPDQLAQVAVYYYLDELSHREIAEVLGCSHRHVGDLLQRLAHWARREELRTCRR